MPVLRATSSLTTDATANSNSNRKAGQKYCISLRQTGKVFYIVKLASFNSNNFGARLALVNLFQLGFTLFQGKD
jgi:hypothetical protein